MAIVRHDSNIRKSASNKQSSQSFVRASIFRGNLNVQENFVEMGGCLILGNYLQNALSLKSYKIVARILSLAHDILTEVQHYMTDSTSQTKSSLKVVALGFTGELWCQSTYQMWKSIIGDRFIRSRR